MESLWSGLILILCLTSADADADAKRSNNQGRNVAKSGKSKSKGRKNKNRSATKQKKKGSSKKKAANKRRNKRKQKKSKKGSRKNPGSRSSSGCARQSTFCPAEKAQALNIYYNKMTNYFKQLKRAENWANIVVKKKGKKDSFVNDALILEDAVGGNLSAPACSSSARLVFGSDRSSSSHNLRPFVLSSVCNLPEALNLHILTHIPLEHT